jgi:hypothetical protein
MCEVQYAGRFRRRIASGASDSTRSPPGCDHAWVGSDGFRIGTDAASGVVTLSFDDAFETVRRDLAVAIATGMSGVSKVVSVDKT